MNKIAIIEPVGGHGGMNYYDYGLARGLAAALYDVVIYTSEETYVPDGLSFKVRKSFKGIWGDAPKYLRAIKFFYCLYATLNDAKAYGITIVHFHFFGYTTLELLCVKLAKLYGFRVVVTAHDVESFSGGHDTGKALKILTSADKVIAHNNVSKKELVSKIALSTANVSVVPHGNYLDSIDVLPDKIVARKLLELAPNDKVLLFFGQIKEVKGLDILLRSLPVVIDRHPNLKLIIAGKVWKDAFSNYEKIISEEGLNGHVISHIRYIPDEGVANYYRAADLIVLPYRKIYQSGVLLMAMSYKVPVLVSNIPGMTEVVVEGKNGYVFESENVANLSLRLIDILSDTEGLVRIGESGFETVSKDYDWLRIGQLTSEVYKALGNE